MRRVTVQLFRKKSEKRDSHLIFFWQVSIFEHKHPVYPFSLAGFSGETGPLLEHREIRSAIIEKGVRQF